MPTTICLKSALNKYFERDPVLAPHRKSGNGEFADVSLVREDKPNQTKPSGNGESEFADVSLVREDKRGQTILSTGHSSQLDILKPNSGLSRQYCTHHTKPLLVFVQKRKHIGEWKLRRSNKFSVYMKEIYKRAHHSSWGLKVIMFNPISGYSIPHCTI